jgi:hypothetical protein
MRLTRTVPKSASTRTSAKTAEWMYVAYLSARSSSGVDFVYYSMRATPP